MWHQLPNQSYMYGQSGPCSHWIYLSEQVNLSEPYFCIGRMSYLNQLTSKIPLVIWIFHFYVYLSILAYNILSLVSENLHKY